MRLHIHAVLLDFMLPDVSGGDVGRALRAAPATRTLPIVMYTSTPEEVVRPVFDGGALRVAVVLSTHLTRRRRGVDAL